MSDEERSRMGRAAVARILELCGNEQVVARRVALYARSREGRAARGARHKKDVVLVNGGEGGGAERLIAAVRDGVGVDFAHGWTSHRGRVRVFGTPTVESLALAGRTIGPVAVSREAAEDPRVRRLLRGKGTERNWESSWGVAAVLAAAGYRGAVVPEVVTEVAPSGLEEPELVAVERAARESARQVAAQREEIAALRGELERIKASRGWGVLQRVYAVLHVLKGRGFPKTGGYDRAGTEATESGGKQGRNQIA
jgi:hypothetical protein